MRATSVCTAVRQYCVRVRTSPDHLRPPARFPMAFSRPALWVYRLPDIADVAGRGYWDLPRSREAERRNGDARQMSGNGSVCALGGRRRAGAGDDNRLDFGTGGRQPITVGARGDGDRGDAARRTGVHDRRRGSLLRAVPHAGTVRGQSGAAGVSATRSEEHRGAPRSAGRSHVGAHSGRPFRDRARHRRATDCRHLDDYHGSGHRQRHAVAPAGRPPFQRHVVPRSRRQQRRSGRRGQPVSVRCKWPRESRTIWPRAPCRPMQV